jgi:predicted membrane chloride channel (bestrophin family)
MPLLQMGRTFLFLWTFSMPLVLRSPFGDASAAMLFLFFLTYGFVGLEVVGLQMMSPFGKQ